LTESTHDIVIINLCLPVRLTPSSATVAHGVRSEILTVARRAQLIAATFC